MAAMHKLAPGALENQILFGADEEEIFDTLFNKLASFANTKQSLKLAKKHPGHGHGLGKGSGGDDPMDVGALGIKGDCWK